MKKILALLVLTVGLLPSIPVFFATAAAPTQEELTKHCRTRLGFGQTEPIYGPMVLQLRRCIDSTREQYERAATLERRAGVTHYTQRYDQAQSMAQPVKETQRSLNTRVEREEDIRLDYYHNSTVEERTEALRQHRIDRRLFAQEVQQTLLRERRAKQQRWKTAIQVCRYYARSERQYCVYSQLAQ